MREAVELPRRRPWVLWAFLGLSVVVNICLGGVLALEKLSAPEDRLGVLKADVRVGEFGGSRVLFTLPKGLTVRDASPRFLGAVGQFEPNRFQVILTTESEDAVDYSPASGKRHDFGEYYSLDLNGVVFGRSQVTKTR